VILLLGDNLRVQHLLDATSHTHGVDVRAVENLDQMTAALRRGNADMVVICGAAATTDGNRLLAAARRARHPVPGLVVTFVHPCLAHVVVGDATGGPVSAKVVDCDNLARLPSLLLAGQNPWQSID
jgi:DNA-binding response OmpR family regulator